MISVEEAQLSVLSEIPLVGAETLPLTQALGRVLAENAVARTSHPASDVSAMDGWAVRAQDGLKLTQIGESSAGHPFAGEVGSGQCVRIFTGATMPAGADAVAIQEEVKTEGASIRLENPAPSGQHVRKMGQDFKTGQTLIAPGKLLAPQDVALLAAMNLPWLRLRRRPRVGILSTGDELALPGEPLPVNGMPSSNGLAVAALVQAWGGEAVDLGIAKDDFESLVEKAKAAHGCDLLVTSGGVSVGAYDKVKDALAALGFKAGFHKIAMKPGKPLMFGRMGAMPVLGLPGNPVSAFVTARLFLRPILRKFLGLDPAIETPQWAVLGASVGPGGSRQEYLRASLGRDTEGRWTATPLPTQDSAGLYELSQANGLILRPIKAPAAKAGDPTQVLLLDA